MLPDLFAKYPALFTAEGIHLDFQLMKYCGLSKRILQGLNVCSPSTAGFAEKKEEKKANYRKCDITL